jgi:hypothetical protein
MNGFPNGTITKSISYKYSKFFVLYRVDEQKQIPIASHKRRYISLFRYGLDYIRQILFHFDGFKENFSDIINFFNVNQTVT